MCHPVEGFNSNGAHIAGTDASFAPVFPRISGWMLSASLCLCIHPVGGAPAAFLRFIKSSIHDCQESGLNGGGGGAHAAAAPLPVPVPVAVAWLKEREGLIASSEFVTSYISFLTPDGRIE